MNHSIWVAPLLQVVHRVPVEERMAGDDLHFRTDPIRTHLTPEARSPLDFREERHARVVNTYNPRGTSGGALANALTATSSMSTLMVLATTM